MLNVCILEPCADVPAAKDTQHHNHLQDQDDCKAISLNDIKGHWMDVLSLSNQTMVQSNYGSIWQLHLSYINFQVKAN